MDLKRFHLMLRTEPDLWIELDKTQSTLSNRLQTKVQLPYHLLLTNISTFLPSVLQFVIVELIALQEDSKFLNVCKYVYVMKPDLVARPSSDPRAAVM
jgi:hypothetical protein